MPVDFELYSDAHRDDPYPAYRELRDHAPVHRCKESGAFVLSRYDDVHAALRTPNVFSSKMDNSRRLRSEGLSGMVAGLRMLFKMTTKMRVTPRRISSWESRAREITAGCMDVLRRSREFDLVQELAIPLPVTLIAEILGIEPDHRADFKRWSDGMIEASTNSGPDQLVDPSILDVLGEMSCYLRPVVRSRRARQEEDLISVLVEPRDGEAALSDYEIFMFIMLLLIAGNETTTNLIGNATDALFEHPDQLERVATDPSLVPALIEEALRYDGPVLFVNRTVVEETVIHGRTLPGGSVVALLLGSANRDERRFPDPDRLDLDRDTRGQLGFGFGVHFCLGASLARLEARAALEALVPELPRLARTRSRCEFLPSHQIRGRSRLELRAA